MKPGDHPEFFRFPAPSGRSRESSIRVDVNGRFWHDNVRLEHPRLEQAFARWITRHPDDGRYILSNHYDWTYITVEDVPFTVVSVDTTDGGQVSLTLNDGTREQLVPSTLSQASSGALYCGVKGGQFEAKFTPPAQLALAPQVTELPDGTVGVSVGEQLYSVPPRVQSSGVGPASERD